MKNENKNMKKPFVRKTSAIAGYYITRIGKRVELSKGQVGAWTTISRDASRAQVANAGFNLDCPEVAEVVKFAR